MSQLLAIPRTDGGSSTYTLTLTARVRQATRAQHARCEALIDLAAMASCVEAYADALVTFGRLQAFVIANTVGAVALAPTELGDGLKRGRDRAAADLAKLGRAYPVGGLEPADEQLGELDGQLGAWYVLEGSALGGTVIARHARSALGQAAGALSYFGGEGRGTAARWQLFQSFADDLEVRGVVDFAGVLRGAERTFDHFLTLPARR